MPRRSIWSHPIPVLLPWLHTNILRVSIHSLWPFPQVHAAAFLQPMRLNGFLMHPTTAWTKTFFLIQYYVQTPNSDPPSPTIQIALIPTIDSRFETIEEYITVEYSFRPHIGVSLIEVVEGSRG
ncbi:hypothetical protein PM082_017001 [Marasmius tenuissimus]|nr:hypothetical protein PM082_017001 [Marasmius tenuissimus]